MTVYIDILVVLNTLVNYFMLLAVKRIARENTSRLRLAAGAIAGGVSSLLIFLESLGILMTLMKITVSFLMVLISFKFTSVKKYLKTVLWLFIISFVFGGVSFALYICFDFTAMIYTNGIIYFDIDMTFLVVASVVSYAVISVVTRLTDKKAPREKEYFVTAENGGKSVSCTALMDTGNNLREPFSGYPVIMADSKTFSCLFGEDRSGGFRIIPVSTVNGSSILKAFRPASVKIGNYKTDKVYIAESAAPIDEYKIILNINLEEELQNEKAEAVVK